MKKLLLLISLFSVNVYAENKIENCSEMSCNKDNKTSDTKIERLMNLMFNKEQLSTLAKSVFQQTFRQAQAQSNKDMPGVEMIIDKMVNKFGSKEVMNDIASIYLKHFNDSEIGEILEFYESPVGQKVLKSMPQVASDCGQVSMRVVQEVMLECIPQENNSCNNNCCIVEK